MRSLVALLFVAGLIIVSVRTGPSDEIRFRSGLRVSDEIPPEEVPEAVAMMSDREFADWARSYNEAQYAAARKRHAAYLADAVRSSMPMWSKAGAHSRGASAAATAGSVLGSAVLVDLGMVAADLAELGMAEADSAVVWAAATTPSPTTLSKPVAIRRRIPI